MVSSGSYSDYQIYTIAKVMQDFDIEKAKEEYDKKYTEKCQSRWSEFPRFIKFLTVDKKYIKEIEYQEIYLGDFNLWENMKIARYDGMI